LIEKMWSIEQVEKHGGGGESIDVSRRVNGRNVKTEREKRGHRWKETEWPDPQNQ